MRVTLCLFVAASLFGAACTDSHGTHADAGPNPERPLFADAQWAIRCEATPGCTGSTDVDVCGFDGGPSCDAESVPVDMSCSVTEDGPTRTFTFQIRQSGPSLTIEGAEVAIGGGDVTGDCVVTVTDAEGTYRGACGSAPPSAAQPCQILGVEFHDDMGNPVFTGRIFCQGLAAEASGSGEREITAAGDGTAPSSRPGHFRIANCPGLEL